MPVKHYTDVYEVPGKPQVFQAHCACGWVGPERASGPGQPRAESDGDEHVDAQTLVPPPSEEVSVLARLYETEPLRYRLWIYGQAAGHVFNADNLSDALNIATKRVEDVVTQGVPIEWDVGPSEDVLEARIKR